MHQPNIAELVERTNAFIRDVVIPYEKDPRNRGGHGPTEDLSLELKAKAREAGLIAPHPAGAQ